MLQGETLSVVSTMALKVLVAVVAILQQCTTVLPTWIDLLPTWSDREVQTQLIISLFSLIQIMLLRPIVVAIWLIQILGPSRWSVEVAVGTTRIRKMLLGTLIV